MQQLLDPPPLYAEQAKRREGSEEMRHGNGKRRVQGKDCVLIGTMELKRRSRRALKLKSRGATAKNVCLWKKTTKNGAQHAAKSTRHAQLNQICVPCSHSAHATQGHSAMQNQASNKKNGARQVSNPGPQHQHLDALAV